MKRTFTVTLELDTEVEVERNHAPGVLDLGPDGIYSQLNNMLEFSPGMRVSHVEEVNPDLETPRMLVLSTAHITKETNHLFEINARRRLPVFYPKKYFDGEDVGYIIPIIDNSLDETIERADCPDDLRAILTLAVDNGCGWVMLDRDGDVIDALRSFDW